MKVMKICPCPNFILPLSINYFISMYNKTIYSIMMLMILLIISCSKDEPDITSFSNYNFFISVSDMVFSSGGDEKELIVTATKEKFKNGVATGEIVPISSSELSFSGISHFKYEVKQETEKMIIYKFVAPQSSSMIQETLRISVKDNKEIYKEILLYQYQPPTYGDYLIEITPTYNVPYTGEKKELTILCKRERTQDGEKAYLEYPMTGITIKSQLSVTAVTITGENGFYKIILDTPKNELNRDIEQSVSFYTDKKTLGVINIIQEKNPEGKTGHIVTLENIIVWED